MDRELDFSLINRISIVEILSNLGIPVNNKKEVFNPIFQKGYDDAYRIDLHKTNSVVNFGNLDIPSGTPYNFVKQYLNLSDKDTFSWFARFLGYPDDYKGEFNKPIPPKFVNTHIGNKEEEEALLKRRRDIIKQFNKIDTEITSDNILEYFKNRGISKETLLYNGARIGVIFNQEKIYKNRVLFPIYNSLREIIGIKARDIFAKDGYKKSINITDSGTGLLFNSEKLKKGHVFVVEGEIDKMTLDEMGLYSNIGNLSGVQTYKQERNDLFERFDKIYLFYDNDKNGAGLSGIINFIKNSPEKEIYYLDIPLLINNNFPEEEREKLFGKIKDINDLYCFCKTNGFDNKQIAIMIKNSCIQKPLVLLEKELSLIKNEIKKNNKSLETKLKIKKLSLK